MKQKTLQVFSKKKRRLIKSIVIAFFSFSMLTPTVNYAGFYHYEKEAAAVVKISGVVTR